MAEGIIFSDENNAQNYQRLIRQQTILAKFGELALRSNDLDEVLTEACHLVGEALGTDLAKVMELQGDGETLLVRAGVGWKPGVVGGATVKATYNSFEGQALKTGEPMISPDIDNETRFSYAPFLTDNGVRAAINVVIGSHVAPPFGILQVDSRTPRGFTQDDTAFLSSYANLLACAVDRQKAEGALRRSKEALETQIDERTHELTQANSRLQAEAVDRERIEDTLRQAQKMEAVGQLTGGLAHDFNNLLAGISGSLELIRARIAQGRTAALDRYVEVAMTSVDRAAALTHRLLAFSRRQTLDPKPTNVTQLVDGLADLFSRTVGPAIGLRSDLAWDLWHPLCDPNQLENVLLNLVINARDAMPNGGNLLIKAANIIVPDRRGAVTKHHQENVVPGDYILLSVTDTGEGMTPDVLTRAFDPFFTTKPLGQGTGLGLSMTHGFVKQSGGHVQLTSESGKGTTVMIYLPRHLQVDVASDGQLRRSNPVILVVEDEPAVRMVLVEMLSDFNYTVLEADTGRAGLIVLETTAQIDLLLTDVGLPGGMNGRQLADAARQHRPELKVLFVTGYAEGAAIASGLMDQGMQVLTKPFVMSNLLARMQKMISDKPIAKPYPNDRMENLLTESGLQVAGASA